MLKGIIFDLDGVLVDSHAAHMQAWREFLHGMGRDVSEGELAVVLEGRKREEILRHFLGELSAGEVREYGTRKDELFRCYARELKPLPGAVEFLEAATEAQLQIGLASSASRARVERTLQELGLERHFRVTVSGDDVAAGKPDPAIFRMAAHGLRLTPENALVCEDAVCGVEAAKAAGMRCLAIAANGRAEALKAAGADRVAPDFQQVKVEDLRGLFGD
ncbi:MAG TPA: HAD family phosphatase [Candidatus Angelobacter sp.]